jgi:hypothetical protein
LVITMVELKVNVTESGVFYLPKVVRDSFGRRIRIIPNARAAVLFPKGARYEDVLASLKVIAADIEQRARFQEREKERRVSGIQEGAASDG